MRGEKCICPIMDNQEGIGGMIQKPVINLNCPVHGDTAGTEEKKLDSPDRESLVNMIRDASMVRAKMGLNGFSFGQCFDIADQILALIEHKAPVSIERMAEILGVSFYDLHPLVMARENHLIKDAKTQERERLKGIILPQLLAISESLPASASDWPEHTRATFFVIRQAFKGD